MNPLYKITSIDFCNLKPILFLLLFCCYLNEGQAQNILCPFEVTVDCSNELDPNINPALGFPSLNIPCELVTFSYVDVIIPGPCAGTYTIERNWTGQGDCNETLACTQIINVVDNTPPSHIIISVDQPRIQCDDPTAMQQVAAYVDQIAFNANPADDCSNVIVSHSFNSNTVLFDLNTCFNNGSVAYYSVIFTGADGCGNESTTLLNIFLFDDNPPVFPTVIPPLELNCNDPLVDQKINTWLNSITAEDPCEGTLTATNNYDPNNFSPSQGCSLANCVEFTATDECGNTATSNACIILTDTDAPIISHPNPLLVLSCDDPDKDTKIEDWLAQAVFIDNCLGLDDVFNTYSENGFSYACGEIGDQTVSFVAFDECGQEGSFDGMITLLPVLPSITCYSDTYVGCFEDIQIPGIPLDWGSSCTSEGEPVRSALTLVSGVDRCAGAIYELSRSIIDDCGLENSCIERYIIQNDAPIVTCIPGESVSCFEDITVSLNDVSYTTSCNYGASVVIEEPRRLGYPNCDGTQYIYRYTVTDQCGRYSFCERVFTIENQAPVLSILPDEIIECFEDIRVDESDLTVSLSCGLGYTIDISGPIKSGLDNCPGTFYTYRYTATDVCGRSSSIDRKFTIDNEGPQITTPQPLVFYCVEDVDVNPDDIEVSTACGQDYTVELQAPDLREEYNCTSVTFEYIYTVTDACGRMAQAIRYVTIEHRAPEMDTPEDLYVTCINEDELYQNFPFASSYCGELEYTMEISKPKPVEQEDNPDCTLALYIVTYSIIDQCGIMICVDQNVFAAEEWLAFSETPNDTMITCGSVLPLPQITAYSSCGGALDVFFSEEEIAEDGIESYLLRTWTATSPCGTEWTHDQEISFDCNDPIIGISTNNLNDKGESNHANFTELTVYPNPVVDRLKVKYFHKGEESFSGTLEVFNLEGNQVVAQLFPIEPGNNKAFINVNDLPSGTYLLILREAGKVLAQDKILKVRP